MKRILSYLFLLSIIYLNPASAQVIDLRTGVNSSGLIAIGSADDTWTVCYPGSNPSLPASYVPTYTCNPHANYNPNDPNVCWITPQVTATGDPEINMPTGDYYYKTTFTLDDVCAITTADFNFARIGGDNLMQEILVNGHSYPVSYSFSPMSSNVTISVNPLHLNLSSTNTILIRLNNTTAYTGIHINGNLTLQSVATPNAVFSTTVTNGTLQATSSASGTHTWEVYGSVDGSPGSYSYIGTYSTLSITASGYTCYKVKHTLVNSCGSACSIQTICDAACDECGPLSEPQDLAFDGSTFSWSAVPGAMSYEVEVIMNAPDCCPNQSGSVTILKFQTTNTSYQPAELSNCFSWRVKVLCANSSYAYSGKKCSNPSCGQTPPTNLQFNKSSLPPTFSWSAVAGAVSYEIEITINDPACCPNSSVPQTYTIPVTGTSYQASELSNCFSWRVKAICANGWSATSSPKCETLSGGGFGKKGDTKPSESKSGNNSDLAQTVKLFPNPTKGLVTIEVETEKDKTYTIGIYDISGKLVKMLEPGKTANRKTTVKWDSGETAKGTYFIKVISSDEQVITKKLVIE